ncbi:Galactose-1-phosphate uridyl transferase, N-terminal domain [Pilibacter termitis]|uniref:Galactose-1-phosphate uridyl transferase, N-terminal domain n=1 Tax=Pilibacter termitis TaxID=263852 RepID=A0A1T4KV27_9ENTE|nr:hypothetical protein [Pilibacter termitis]SJZ46256.1 Galactose-1-phosphate uridyl transferase, N-terminal domain [Pilibacter termitis]
MIDQFIDYAIQNGGWMELDRQYLANKIFDLSGGDMDADSSLSAKQTAEALAKKATDKEDIQYMIFVQLLDLLTPPPSVVNAYFAEHYHQSPETATKYYHDLLKGIGFFETSYAKKEEDFLNFYAEGTLVSMNNRFIRMNLSGQSWGFQLLPNENEEIGMIFPEYEAQYSTLKKVLTKMFEITETFPHYEISMAPAWFRTAPRKENHTPSVLHELTSTELTEACVYEETNQLELTSYNTDELIVFAKQIPYQAYKTITGYRTNNQFTLLISFKDEFLLRENLLRIK